MSIKYKPTIDHKTLSDDPLRLTADRIATEIAARLAGKTPAPYSRSTMSRTLKRAVGDFKSANVRNLPTTRQMSRWSGVDGSGLAREIFTSQVWSVQPCVRPVSAAHRAAGLMPSADQVPVKSPHSTMHWHMWVVLIAGSTGSALRAVRPPNLHTTPDFGAISLRRECDGFLVALTPGHHGPSHPCNLVGDAMAATFAVAAPTKP